MADAADAVETGAGTVHERLFEAFTLLARIGPEDIPDGDLRAAFAELMAALTSERPKGTEGRLVATLKAIDEDQAEYRPRDRRPVSRAWPVARALMVGRRSRRLRPYANMQ